MTGPRSLLATVLLLVACAPEMIETGADEGDTETGGDTEDQEAQGETCQSVDEFACMMTNECGPLYVTYGDYPDTETDVAGDWPCVEAAMANNTPTRIEVHQDSLEDPTLDELTVIWVIGDGTAAVIDVDLTVEPQPDCFEVTRYELNYSPVFESCEQCTEHALAGGILLGWRFNPVEGVPACG